jgi:phosphate transport system permease protein
VLLPASRRGIGAAVALGFGRAMGETMALTMLIGGSHTISWSIFAPADTLTTLLVNRFPESATPLDMAALMAAALVLLGLSLAVHLIHERLLKERHP